MLSTHAEYPYPGAQAFLRPDAQPVRIIQRRADGQVTIAVVERFRKASSTRTVALTDLAETQAEARAIPEPRSRRAGA